MADNRTAHEDVEADVNSLILEYIAYNATKALLAEFRSSLDDASRKRKRGENGPRRAPGASVSNHMYLVDSFLTRLKSGDAPYTSNRFLSFRLQLLQFVTLYTLRHTSHPATPPPSALNQLRASNHERAVRWRTQVSQENLSPREKRAEKIVHSMNQNRRQVLDNHSNRILWLDLVPFFVRLTAAELRLHFSTETATTDEWLDLAEDLLTQVALEQMIMSHETGTSASLMLDALAWGPVPQELKGTGVGGPEINQEDRSSNDVFRVWHRKATSGSPHPSPAPSFTDNDDDDAELSSEPWYWRRNGLFDLFFQDAYVRRPSNLDNGPNYFTWKSQNFKMLRKTYPDFRLDEKMCEYLSALAKVLEKPILAQLEDWKSNSKSGGKPKSFMVDGKELTSEPTEALKRIWESSSAVRLD